MDEAIQDSSGYSNSQQSLTNVSVNWFLGVETPSCTLFRFILYGIICGIICLLGLIGNILSFLILLKDRSSPIASFLLQSLAVADTCFLLLWMIHYSIREYFTFFASTSNITMMYIRIYTFPILYMAQMETIWLTVVVAMNRFMAVCVPYLAPQLCTKYNVYKEVIVVTAISIIYNLPKCFERSVENINGTVTWNYTQIGQDKTYKLIYNDVMYYLFTFIAPLLILAFLNTKVIIAYRAAQRRKSRMMSRRMENDHNITLVMIVVVLVFMICQAPARIVQIVYKYYFTHCMEASYFLIHISNTLEVLNSSLNFLIYIIFRKRFRDILVESYCLKSVAALRRNNRSITVTTEGLALTEHAKTPSNSIKSANSAKDSLKGSLKKDIADHESNRNNINTTELAQDTECFINPTCPRESQCDKTFKNS